MAFNDINSIYRIYVYNQTEAIMKSRKPSTKATAVSSPAEAITAPVPVEAEIAAAPVAEAVNTPVEATPAREAVAAEATPAKEAKAKKEKKVVAKAPKRIRDSFTMPASDYATLTALKQRARLAGVHAKKSQLLLAGLKALAAFPDSQFLDVVSDLGTQKAANPV